jgi:hypothetical protein
MIRWWRRRQRPGNGHAAAQARADAVRRLAATRRQRPDANRARDTLADLVEQALRGRA